MPTRTAARLRLRARRRPRWRRRLSARVLAGLAALASLAAVAAPSGAQSEPRHHQPPVDAPVSDSFRPPESAFGAGNRGLEYDTQPGDEVRASAEGEVVFAGLVAGTQHVTVLHSDGVRTSYSFLDQVDVVVGQAVGRGDRIGQAGDAFHFGARRADAYFDPASLFGSTGAAEVELLPFEVAPGSTADEELAAIIQLSTGGDSGWGFDLPGLGDVAGWVTDVAIDRVALLQHYALELNPAGRMGQLTWDLAQRLADPPPCTDDPPPARPASESERRALLVGGLGTSTGAASIEDLRVDELGYDPDDVTHFSYAGGDAAYESADTQGDLRASASLLADLVERTAADSPTATIDVFGHSMGGVVGRLALIELERRGFDLSRLGLVATFGSPHQGADAATAVAAANSSLTGNVGLDIAAEILPLGLDPDAAAIAQLAETSDVIDELDREGVPEGLDLVSIGASGDVIVAAPQTEVADARNVTVDLLGEHAHGDLVSSDAATSEVALALAGMPQRCEGIGELMRKQLTGHAISYAEDLAGAALLPRSP